MADLICRSCRREVEPGVLICPHCRANLTGGDAVIDTTMVEPPPADPAETAEPSDEAFFCPSCTATLPSADAQVCPACLTPLGGGLAFRFGASGTGWRHLVAPGASLMLGREGSPAAHLLATYDTVSRRHAQISVGRGQTGTVADLGSTNGTFVDGVRVPTGTTAELRPGSRLRLGGTVEFTVERG